MDLDFDFNGLMDMTMNQIDVELKVGKPEIYVFMVKVGIWTMHYLSQNVVT